MNTLKNFLYVLTCFVIMSMTNANAATYPYLSDVTSKANAGIQCSYHGVGGQVASVDAYYKNAANNKGYGGVAYIYAIDDTVYNGAISDIMKRQIVMLYWNGAVVAQIIEGTGVDAKGVFISGGYKYYVYTTPDGVAGGGHEAYIFYWADICREPVVSAPTYQSTVSEDQTVACPAAQPSGSILQRRTYELWSDGSKKNYTAWTNVSNTCVAVKQSTQSESQSLSCPASQPSGTWTQSRTYDLWSDGSRTNYSSWVNVTYTCTAIKQSTITQTRSLSCAVGQTGSITQTRSYDLWTDGSIKNYSNWVVSQNTCVIPAKTAGANFREACGEAYTGYKEYRYVIKFKNENYTVKDADGTDVTYVLSTPYQESEIVNNNCVLIPTQVTATENGTQSQTCDSYYGATTGTYTGSVYKYGQYVSTYDSNTKTTNTSFNVTSVDTTSCVTQISDMSLEKDIRSCASGEQGELVYYRYIATDTKGVKSYPYGSEWLLLTNSCASTSDDNSSTSTDTDNPEGLLSNIYITSTEIMNNENFSTYLSDLSSTSWSSNQSHKLIIDVEDLSTGKYDSAKISSAISRFKSVVGNDNAYVVIKVPKTLDKYVGNNNITSKNIENKKLMMKNIDYQNNSISVNYLNLNINSTIDSLKEENASVLVLPNNTDMKNIIIN